MRLMEKAELLTWQQMVHNYVHNRIITGSVFDQPALWLPEVQNGQIFKAVDDGCAHPCTVCVLVENIFRFRVECYTFAYVILCRRAVYRRKAEKNRISLSDDNHIISANS